MDSRGGCVSKILYVEMKESGPLGGHAPGRLPRFANVLMGTRPLDGKGRAEDPLKAFNTIEAVSIIRIIKFNF